MQTTSADGTEISYSTTGSGTPVVLVGGAFSDGLSNGPLGELLAPRLTAVSYARRGRGDSGDTLPYSVDREVEDLTAVMAAVGASAVYGMSSGGLLALLTASRVPVDRVAVYEPPFNADPSTAFAEEQADRIAAGDREGAVRAFLGATGMPKQVIDDIRDGMGWPHLINLAHTLPYDHQVVAETGLPDLAQISARTLVLSGAASPPFLTAAAGLVADTVPGAKHIALAEQTHNVDIALLAPLVADFFTESD
ncbi:alpha/beta hydrolase [Actinokineospora sp. NBRC 105648]|uniref:alpha/beta fold hydrolase n=1 Tax=Actinokineospora sp. NBRC 105648 TaxID=3032206 RepID=UPI0024A176B1|nr:alpha/beta hydrolase [Actinokineospora sp. NBRC 105648]GLZ38164.1 alpha/beta hydrolase [Actinokineospora sp. NBRC 105648]